MKTIRTVKDLKELIDQLDDDFSIEFRVRRKLTEEELENTTLTGTSGGGMVEVTCTGKKKITSVKIKPEIVDPDDIEMLEDLIVASVNDAYDQADKLEKSLKGDMPSGLGI